jgi:hypothetical protein
MKEVWFSILPNISSVPFEDPKAGSAARCRTGKVRKRFNDKRDRLPSNYINVNVNKVPVLIV